MSARDQMGLFAALVPQPLVVAYGAGLDSTAMLVEMHNRGIRPDLIQFADTGAEKPETYAYLPIMDAWLASVGFPPITVCKYQPKTAPYSTLEGNCLANETLPSLAFGMHSCAIKFKQEPQARFLKTWAPAVECWAAGGRVKKAIGYDDGEQDRRRAEKAAKHAWPQYEFWYALQEWGMDRTDCERVIREAGLPVPVKSACFFCPASKKSEIVWLRDTHPLIFQRALKMEAGFLNGKHARPATGDKKKRPTVGMGRNFAWADLEHVATVEDDDKEVMRP